MNIVDITDLTKIYQTGMKRGNIVALQDVSLTVEQGEIFGLLGPNGAGKTTLVKTVLGITKATSGDVRLGGQPTWDAHSRDRVGFLPESHRFPHHLTGMGLLELTRRLSGLSIRGFRDQALELLKLVGMETWAQTKIRKYSKGMVQRIGIAQALVTDPDVVFLDEPTDGVDPVGKVEIRQVLMRLRSEGKTIFLNSHLLSEVEAVADRVAILLKGKLVRVGTVESMTVKESQYEIEANLGNQKVDIPPEIGKRLSITTHGLTVALNNPADINVIIDELRGRNISIKSVKPMQTTLEQSFFETVTAEEGEAQ